MKIRIKSKYINNGDLDFYNIESHALKSELVELIESKSEDGSCYYNGCKVYADGKLVLNLEEVEI